MAVKRVHDLTVKPPGDETDVEGYKTLKPEAGLDFMPGQLGDPSQPSYRKQYGFGAALGAGFSTALDSNTLQLATDWFRSKEDPTDSFSTKEDYENSIYYRPGIEWFPNMSRGYAARAAEIHDTRATTADVWSHTGGFGTIGFMGGALMGGIADPINLIPANVLTKPFTMAATGMKLLESAQAARLAIALGKVEPWVESSRLRSALGVGLGQAAIDAGIQEPLEYSRATKYQTDYDWHDALFNIGMSGLLGGVLGGAAYHPREHGLPGLPPDPPRTPGEALHDTTPVDSPRAPGERIEPRLRDPDLPPIEPPLDPNSPLGKIMMRNAVERGMRAEVGLDNSNFFNGSAAAARLHDNSPKTPGTHTVIVKDGSKTYAVTGVRNEDGLIVHALEAPLDANGKAIPGGVNMITDPLYRRQGMASRSINALDQAGFGVSEALARSAKDNYEVGFTRFGRATAKAVLDTERPPKPATAEHVAGAKKARAEFDKLRAAEKATPLKERLGLRQRDEAAAATPEAAATTEPKAAEPKAAEPRVAGRAKDGTDIIDPESIDISEFTPVRKKTGDSSNVDRVYHDGQDLYVRYKSGGIYRYNNIDEAHFKRMISGELDSVGGYLHRIRQPANYERLVGDEATATQKIKEMQANPKTVEDYAAIRNRVMGEVNGNKPRKETRAFIGNAVIRTPQDLQRLADTVESLGRTMQLNPEAMQRLVELNAAIRGDATKLEEFRGMIEQTVACMLK